jgi:hypothetical protein
MFPGTFSLFLCMHIGFGNKFGRCCLFILFNFYYVLQWKIVFWNLFRLWFGGRILVFMGIVSKVSELLCVLFDDFAASSPWERILMHALWSFPSLKLWGKRLSFFFLCTIQSWSGFWCYTLFSWFCLVISSHICKCMHELINLDGNNNFIFHCLILFFFF